METNQKQGPPSGESLDEGKAGAAGEKDPNSKSQIPSSKV